MNQGQWPRLLQVQCRTGSEARVDGHLRRWRCLPVGEEIYRMAMRLRLNVLVVSNGSRPIRPPGTPNVSRFSSVTAPDAADDWITEHISVTDVCVTSDIPLASRCLQKGARIVSPTGRQWTEANMGSPLAY